MKFIFEAHDIQAGVLFSIQLNSPKMIIKQHLSSAESESKRLYGMLNLETGNMTSPWMTQEKLAEYLTGNLARPLTRTEVFVSDTN